MVQINTPLSGSPLLTTKSHTTDLVSQFKVGQLLQANINQVQGQQVQLTIGNQTLIAQSKEPNLQTGMVQIQIKQTQPTLELVIIQPHKSGANQPTLPSQQILQNAYRQFIPNQMTLPQALQQINLLQNLPASIQMPINQLLEQILKPLTNLTGKELQQKLIDSGLFLESKLASPKTQEVQKDVKAQLLKLQQLTQNEQSQTPTSTLAKLSSTLTQAINRLTVQQLQLYENPLITPLEIPIESKKLIDKVSVEFRKQQGHHRETWEVYLDLKMPDGDLSAKLTLQEQDALACYLWCETPTLQSLIEDNLALLKKQLTEQNLKLNTIQIVPLKPSKSAQTTKIALIDIHI